MKELLARLSRREKSILVLALVALTGLLMHALIIEPLSRKTEELKDAVEQGMIDLKWMQSAVHQLPNGKTLTQATNFEGSLANMIDQEVRRQKLNGFLTQMTPINDDEIRIRYTAIDFNQLLNFIAQVNLQGLSVKDLRINAADTPGDVDCSLVLEKTG